MGNHLTFESWSMSIKSSRQIINAREKVSQAAKKLEFPYAKRILIATATSDICRIFLKRFSSFDLFVQVESRPSLKGLSIKLKLPDPAKRDTNGQVSQDIELLEILKNEIKTTSLIFDELSTSPENGVAPILTLIKWNYAQSDEK